MSLEKRLCRLLGSPQAKRAKDRGRREMAKPQNRRRRQQLLRRIAGRPR